MKSARGATATGANATGTAALGALALGAMALGAMAVGALAIGRLSVGRARLRRVEIGELAVGRLDIGPSGRQPGMLTEAAMQTADDIIRLLWLQPHPEGGHFRETFRDSRTVDGRAASTAIYFLLRRGERSHWHRVDATEVWHFYAGAPLELTVHSVAAPFTILLGGDLAAGHQPQAVIPAGAWQGAAPLGDWTLVGCTVAPGFQFSGFELAPEGWSPEQG